MFRRSVSTVEPSFGSTDEQRSAKKKEEQSTAPVDFELRDENSFPALGVSNENHKSHSQCAFRLETPQLVINLFS